MKWITFSIAIFLLTANSFAQGHFVTLFDANAPDYMNVNVIEATINGLVMEAGDEIAVFDGTLCCAKVILSGPIIYPSVSAAIKVSSSYATPQNGYLPGHAITYKFWDSSNSLEISGISSQYVNNLGNPVATPTFTNGETAFVKLSYTAVVNSAPVANAGIDQTVNEGALVTLDGSASTDPENNTLSYLWTAPSGITLNSTTVAKPTFTAPEVSANTNYTFSLVVNDGKVNSTTDQVVIVVQNCTISAPTVGTITQPTCALASGSVVLNGLPTTGTWTLTRSPGGTTTTGTGTSSTISALAAGTYTYTVTNASGCISAASANVVINAQAATPTAPTVGTITQPTCALATGSVVLNGLPATGTWTLSRTPGGTTTTGTGTSSTISALSAGTYIYTVTNASGCISAASANVVINAQAATPTAPTIGTITQPTCALATGSVVLNGLPATGTWTLTRSPGGTTSTGTGTSSTISALAAGTYTYSVTNASGCISAASANVVINAQAATPTAPTVGTITQPTCALATGSVVLNGLPATGTWTLTRSPGGTTTTSTGTSSTISALATGTYTYTVTNASGCISAASANVVINAQPATPSAPTVGTITQPTCALATGSVVLNGLPATGTWILTRSPGGTTTTGTGTSSTISALAAGTYMYTVANSAGCISAASANVVINAQPAAPPAPTVGTITQPTEALATGSAVLNGLPATGTWTLTRSPGGTTSTGTGTSSTISALAAGTYTYTVTNASGCISSTSATIFINSRPTANAGADQTVNEGVTVTLDGSASTDPDNNTLTYLWTAPSGIILSSTTAAKPTFTAPEVLTNQTYTISLIVNDGIVNSIADQVIITVRQVNKAPVANAGPDQYLDEGVLVTLNGSASSDPDNNTLTYSWSAPEGISLSSATAAKPTFTAPEVMANQTYTFSLIVNDGTVSSTVDQVFIAIKQINKAPVANAGPDQSVEKNTLYTLNGTSSIDPDGDVLTYLWTAPSGIILSSNSVARPTFTTPATTTATNFTFTLTVSDGKLSSISDQIIITLKQSNLAPEAKAGIDQSIDEGSLVILDGSASSDPDGDPLVYTWVAPPGITLNSTTAAKPTFTAPEVMINQTYTFSLIVNDGTVSSIADQVVITVRQINKVPVANAGTDYTAVEGSTVTLNGSASFDRDNNAISYLWTAPAGITLSSRTIINPKFTAPNLQVDQDYVFSLIVNDGIVNSIADQVIITVRHINGSPVANAGTSQTVNEGVMVTLDGSASTDPDNDALTYKWTAPAEITLNSTTALKPRFTAPEVMTDRAFTFSLVVNDGTASSTAEVIITVKQINRAPVANAGPDQSVSEGALATLDGSASTDPDNNILTYNWSAPAEITLSSTTAAKPTFTAPDVTTDRTYTFLLVVNDGMVNSTTDQLFITVRQFNKAPVLASSKSYSANEDTPQEFLIEGSDIENDPINFSIENLPSFLRLTKKTNTSALLSGTFTNQYIGVNTFKLVLSDGISSTQETVSISVTNVDDAPYVKDSIKSVSVNKGAIDLVIDLKPVFADDDSGDILNFSVTSNTNDKIVTAKITGTDLTLSFSKEYSGLAQILITATSNGKVAQSKFNIEVKIPTGIELPYDDAEVSIYPNPTEGEVHLKFDRIPENGTWINVYNETGRLITKSVIKSNEENLNLKGYVPGIYFIQIAQKKQKTYKIVLK